MNERGNGGNAIDSIVAMFEGAEAFSSLDLDAFVSHPVDEGDDDPKPRRRVADQTSPRKSRPGWTTEHRWIAVDVPGDVDPAAVGPFRPLFGPFRRRAPAYRVAPFDRGAWPGVLCRRLRICSHFDQSDTDNAKRLLVHFGHDLLVRIQEGGKTPSWVTWDGRVWDAITGVYRARRLAQQIGDMIKLELAALGAAAEERRDLDDGKAALAVPLGERTLVEATAIQRAAAIEKKIAERSSSRMKFAVTSKNGGRIAAMLDQAAAHVLVPPETFNADPLRLATPTQTLHFVREIDDECPDPDVVRHRARVVVRDGHDRRDRITVMVPHAYVPDASAPNFRAFVDRFLPDPDVRRFVQVATGLGVLGLTEQVLVFHYGDGANGKSVFLEVISRVLGPLASGLPSEAISGDEPGGVKASPEIARLDGKRFVRVSEIPEGEDLREDFVKRITGSESFPARNLFEGYYEFKPIFVPHMTGNGYPKIRGTDNGIWRRMRVVKWPVTLAPEEWRQFEDVVGEMVAEGEGVLAWLVEGARIYLEEGLVSPPAVIAETQTYRDEMDTVGGFVRACVTLTDDAEDFLTGRDLYGAYRRWAEASGIKPVFEAKFGRDIKRVKGIVYDGARVRLYRCITLHDVPPAEPRTPSDRVTGSDDPLSPGW